MRFHRACWKLPLAAILFAAVVPMLFAQQSRPNSGATDSSAYDRIVEDFIQFDIGNVRDPIAIERIRTRFNGLKEDDAVPALVRGLNRSTRMRASCPITAITGRLRGLLSVSKNPEVGTHVLRNLEQRDVGQYNSHINGVFAAAEQQVIRIQGKEQAEKQFKQRMESDGQRMAYVPGRKLTDLAARDPGTSRPDAGESNGGAPSSGPRSAAPRGTGKTPAGSSASLDLRNLSTSELADQLRVQASQFKVLEEFNRRAAAGAEKEVAERSESVARVLKDGDDAVREAAARLLGLIRCEKVVPQLIDALDDSSPKVRSAAATALTRTTRQLFGPNDNATPAETQQAIVRWRDWWNR